jgi:hypothetical protein
VRVRKVMVWKVIVGLMRGMQGLMRIGGRIERWI